MPSSGRPIRAAGGVATIRAAEGDAAKPRRFAGVAYTGQPMRPMGWGIPLVVDLTGVKFPASLHRPALRQHDPEQIVGHTDGIRITAEGIEVEGPFSGERQHTDKVTVPADGGFPWQLSIGATPTRMEFLEAGAETTVNGRTVLGPCDIARETELSEISFVPNGADGDTSAVVAHQGVAVMFKGMLKTLRSGGNVKAARYSDEQIDKMSEDEAKTNFKKCMADDDAPNKDADDAEKKAKAEEEKKAKAEEEKKKEEEAKAAGRTAIAAAWADEVKAARQAAAAEMRRQSEITARCQKYGGIDKVKLDDGRTVDLIPHAIEAGWTADHTELHALRSSRATVGPHFHLPNQPETSDAVLECALFQAAGHEFKLFDDDFFDRPTAERGPLPGRYKRQMRAELNARYPDQVQQAAHTLFRGRMGLHQYLTRVAAAQGYRGSEVVREDNLGEVAFFCSKPVIRADGGSTAALSNTLANVQNKFLGQGYLSVERAWAEICYIRNVKDFKATKNINLFGDFEYLDVGPSGELKNAVLQDQAFANQAATSGRIMTLTRTHIINDDLGALTGVPLLFGRGAGLKLNKAFWTKFLAMGNDEGGSTAFWAAAHTITGQQGNSNYISGGSSALSSTSLQTAKQTFDKQVGPDGNPLGLEARILLYPVENDQTAWELLNSSFIVAGGGSSVNRQPSDNRWKGKYKPVMSRYLSNSNYTGYSTTAWWLLADPGECPVIEVVFLNGQEMPTVQTAGPDFQFNVLGVTTRAFLDSGVEKQNFRGGVKSAGA